MQRETTKMKAFKEFRHKSSASDKNSRKLMVKKGRHVDGQSVELKCFLEQHVKQTN